MRRYLPGNISIFVLFVLLAVSLLGLLTVFFIQQILAYQGSLYAYYQAYYYAKAGMQTLFGLHAIHKPGFSYAVPLDFFSGNISCTQCHIDAYTKARSRFFRSQQRQLSDCGSGFLLETGQTVLVPLFFDNSSGTLATLFTDPPTYQTVHQYFPNFVLTRVDGSEDEHALRFGMLVSDDISLVDNGVFIQEYTGTVQQSLESFLQAFSAYAIPLGLLAAPSYRFYLLLANVDTTPIRLCLYADDVYQIVQFPSDVVYIRSNAYSPPYTLGLEALYDSTLPQFLLQTYTDL